MAERNDHPPDRNLTGNPVIQRYQTPPLNPPYELYNYQKDTQQWMERLENQAYGRNSQLNHGIVGGMLVLSMGLGKTLISLYHTFKMQKEKKEQFPTLVIASKTVLQEWRREGIDKFYPESRVCYFHKEIMGKKKYDAITSEELRSCSIIFTTYDVLLYFYRKLDLKLEVCILGAQFTAHYNQVIRVDVRARPDYDPTFTSGKAIYYMPYSRVIVDESQRIANYSTKTFKAIMAVYGRFKFLLSGTPVRNYETDLWSQLRFCGFDGIQVARRWRNVTSYKHYDLDRFVYVKNYEDVGMTLPEKIEHIYYVVMSENQRKLYNAYLWEIRAMFQIAYRTVNMMAILAIFTRLRQTCIAPHIIVRPKKKGHVVDDNVLKNTYDVESPEGDWIRDKTGDAGFLSPKIIQIVDIIRNLPNQEKVIVFSMFTSCLQMVEDAVEEALPTIKTEYVDGQITGTERQEIIESFKTNPSIQVLYVHYKVGGEGLNITAATHIICIEPWWTHAVHNQGIARAWRHGQTKTVHVHWVLTAGTIEEEILKMCENKHGMSEEYLYGKYYEKKEVALSKRALEKMVNTAIAVSNQQQ